MNINQNIILAGGECGRGHSSVKFSPTQGCPIK